MKIQESGENYLETILLLKNKKGYVRSIDIANELQYTKPSVSRAMGILKREGYIVMESNGYIELTDKGVTKANEVYERHCMITEYLKMTLGIDQMVADQDACRIEHVISEEAFKGIKEYVREHGKLKSPNN